jgi:4-amino-4-deoxy-L-arabinose transferase-like glycosyltransferase
MNDILFNQTAKRYTRSWDHAQPPWYHLGVMLTMWLPALLALPWALPAWRRRLQRHDPRYLLPLAWWLLVVVFFSFPSGKRDVYIMPALPMACLALAPLLPGLLRKAWPRRLGFAFGALIAAVALAIGTALLLGESGLRQRLVTERGMTAAEMEQLGWLVLAIGMWLAAALLWFRVRRAELALVVGLAGLWTLFGLVGYPLLNNSSSARNVMTRAGQLIGPDAELGLVAWREQILFEADRPVQTFGFGKEEHWGVEWKVQWRDGIAWMRAAPQRRWLFVLGESLPDCVQREQAVHVGVANRRDWWLVPAAAVPADCMASELIQL